MKLIKIFMSQKQSFVIRLKFKKKKNEKHRYGVKGSGDWEL